MTLPRTRIRPATVLAIARATLSRPTAPYREGAVIEWVREFVAARPHLRLHSDPDRNLVIRRRGVRASRAPLVLAAHMDHPGFRALRSRPIGGRGDRGGRSGRVRVDARFLGGVAREFFAGAGARFFVGADREIPARVIRARPDPRSGELRVELEATESVPRGAFGMWDLPAFRRDSRQPDRLITRVADDLAGIAAILALLEAVDTIDPRRRVDVRGVFTRAEEVGFVGALAIAAAGRLPPRARIVAVEASKALPHAPQGAGPILRVGDRTSVFDDGLTRWMARVGDELTRSTRGRFRYQRRLMDGGTCEASAYQQFGYRCAGLCLPLGNYHNMSERGRIAAETIRLSDLVGLARFFEALVHRDARCPRAGRRDPLRARLDTLLRRSRLELRRDPSA